MGNCSERELPEYEWNEIISDIFTSCPEFVKYNYKSLEQTLVASSKANYITRSTFVSLFQSTSNYLSNLIRERYYSSFFHSEEINIYELLLYLIPLIKDSNLTYLKNFYDAVSKLIIGDNSYTQFKNFFHNYLTFNLHVTTLIAERYINKSINYKKEQKEQIREMREKFFNPKNIKFYLDKLFFGFEKNNNIQDYFDLNFEKIQEIFYQKQYLFDFVELRKDFIHQIHISL